MRQIKSLSLALLLFVPAVVMANNREAIVEALMVQERGAGSAVKLEIQRLAELLPTFIEKHQIVLPEGMKLSDYQRTVRRILGQEKPYILISVVPQASLNGEPLTAVNDGPNGELQVTAWEWYQLRDPKLKIAKVHHEVAGLTGKFDRVFYNSSRPLLNYLEKNPQALSDFYSATTPVAKMAPKKIDSASTAPAGWEVLSNDERFAFSNPYTALDQCQNISRAYQAQYKFVTCELLAKSGKETFRWTEVHTEQEYKGKTTSTSDQSVNMGVDILFLLSAAFKANDKQVREEPIIVNKPVKMEMFKEYATVSYGYRILARQELVLNPDQVNRVILNTAVEPEGFFVEEKPARSFCRDMVLQLRNLTVEKEYEAAGRVYQHENGKYACLIQGRRKYMATE